MIDSRVPSFSLSLFYGCLFGLCSLVACAAEVREQRLVYQEKFAPYRNVEKHIRISQSFGSWSVKQDAAGRFLSVKTDPAKGFGRALLVWDLAPIRFQKISVLVKVLDSNDHVLNLSLSLQDVSKRSFVVEMKPSGEVSDGWTRYSASLREDTKRIYDKGKEISPFVHGRGEVKTSFEGFDFDNLGFTTVFMNLHGVGQKQITIGFRDFSLFAEL